jgi:LmbE family N-acetylglucosaminyl deacetylase
LKPAALITFGPGGISGHSDHRMVSSLVTQVFLDSSRRRHRPEKLYWVVLPASRLRHQAPQVLCQQTQWGAPEKARRVIQMNLDITGGHVFLRLAASAGNPSARPESGIFASAGSSRIVRPQLAGL